MPDCGFYPTLSPALKTTNTARTTCSISCSTFQHYSRNPSEDNCPLSSSAQYRNSYLHAHTQSNSPVQTISGQSSNLNFNCTTSLPSTAHIDVDNNICCQFESTNHNSNESNKNDEVKSNHFNKVIRNLSPSQSISKEPSQSPNRHKFQPSFRRHLKRSLHNLQTTKIYESHDDYVNSLNTVPEVLSSKDLKSNIKCASQSTSSRGSCCKCIQNCKSTLDINLENLGKELTSRLHIDPQNSQK